MAKEKQKHVTSLAGTRVSAAVARRQPSGTHDGSIASLVQASVAHADDHRPRDLSSVVQEQPHSRFALGQVNSWD